MNDGSVSVLVTVSVCRSKTLIGRSYLSSQHGSCLSSGDAGRARAAQGARRPATHVESTESTLPTSASIAGVYVAAHSMWLLPTRVWQALPHPLTSHSHPSALLSRAEHSCHTRRSTPNKHLSFMCECRDLEMGWICALSNDTRHVWAPRIVTRSCLPFLLSLQSGLKPRGWCSSVGVNSDAIARRRSKYEIPLNPVKRLWGISLNYCAFPSNVAISC